MFTTNSKIHPILQVRQKTYICHHPITKPPSGPWEELPPPHPATDFSGLGCLNSSAFLALKQETEVQQLNQPPPSTTPPPQESAQEPPLLLPKESRPPHHKPNILSKQIPRKTPLPPPLPQGRRVTVVHAAPAPHLLEESVTTPSLRRKSPWHSSDQTSTGKKMMDGRQPGCSHPEPLLQPQEKEQILLQMEMEKKWPSRTNFQVG